MSAKEDLEQWLQSVNERVRRNVTIMTPEDVGQPYMLHISMDTSIKKFIPVIGRRQAPMEDRTIPRITVAPTLLGCLIGFAASENVFKEYKGRQHEQDLSYKGGFKIYAIPYAAALKPTNKLVYDSTMSDEYWLTAYNPETTEYVPTSAGKFFYESITLRARDGKSAEAEVTIYAEITQEGGIQFSKNIFLSQGYWRIHGPAGMHARNWKDDKAYETVEIDRATYSEYKLKAADMLGLVEQKPSFINWK